MPVSVQRLAACGEGGGKFRHSSPTSQCEVDHDSAKTSGSANCSIDDIDLALLSALKEDARDPIGTLSDVAGVSRATAYARLARLRGGGCHQIDDSHR